VSTIRHGEVSKLMVQELSVACFAPTFARRIEELDPELSKDWARSRAADSDSTG
jgi:hypothetical protein